MRQHANTLVCRDESIMLFTPPIMLFTPPIMLLSNSQEIMLKKVPIMLVSFSTKCPFLTITTTLAAILRFRAKSEGLGDFSLLNNETTQTSTSWPGSWESSGSLLELSTTAGPLLLLVLGPLSMLLLGSAVDDSIWRALHVHYSRKTARLFPNYALCFCGLIIPEIMPAY